MRYVLLIFSLFLISCGNQQSETKTPESLNLPIHEKTFMNLGNEEQYVEIMGTDKQNPILILIHGGPGWPQTPQFRYFNSEIADVFTVVLWEQRGSGRSYMKNPEPKDLTLEQLISDGFELTDRIKEKYPNTDVYLAGYSSGSVIGLMMAQRRPSKFKAYIGMAQVINIKRSFPISLDWISEQAKAKQDRETLATVDSLRDQPINSQSFMVKYQLLSKYGGAVHNHSSEAESEKAMTMYPDYKDYDWMAGYEYSTAHLREAIYSANFDTLTTLSIPVYLIEGRHDWNVPAVMAAKWLKKLDAPHKDIFWLENSAHNVLEEEPDAFNRIMMTKIAPH
jgi:proline iminopeptidase